MTETNTITEWATKMMGGFTDAQLSLAFDCVKDATNWKLPIETVVGPSVTSITREQFAAAIVFYTGSVAEFTDNTDGGYTVTATGYYAEIGS